ncbi:protein TIME FOR COFFEE-like [Tasmannia lanceolata]|uniref:protein TIME FOR COFFEE-like n=1 Tax=Tasmannia lanceolata TaxID=3420 RepID=UPI0040632348
MERNRENRRGTRRSRGSVIRDPSGDFKLEDGGNDLVRDRSNGKKERPSRRRRLSSNESFHVERDGSSEESLDDDHEEEGEPIRGGGSRRSTRTKSQLKRSDEIIGVSVPRKARSASTKRFQDSFSAVRQSSSSSPAHNSAASVSPSSSNASMRADRRMNPASTYTRQPTTSKVSFSESEAEVAQFLYGLTRLQSHHSPAKPEIFRSSSPKLEFKHKSANEGSVSFKSKASSPVSTHLSQPSSSYSVMQPQHSNSIPATTAMAPKRKNPRPIQLEDSGNPTMVACSFKPSDGSTTGNSNSSVSASAAIKIEDKDSQATKPEVTSPNADKNVVPINSGSEAPLSISSSSQIYIPRDFLQPEEKPSPSRHVEPKPFISSEMKLNSIVVPITVGTGALDANCQVPVGHNQQANHKDSSSCSQDLPVASSPDANFEAPKNVSLVSVASEGVKRARLEIDLMAPPGNSCLDDPMPDGDNNAAPGSENQPSLAVGEIVGKSHRIASLAEKIQIDEVRVKLNYIVPDEEEKLQIKQSVGAMSLEKKPVNERETEHHDVNNLDKCSNKQHSQKLPKSTTRKAERTVPPVSMTSTPMPMTIPGWPSGLPPFGYLGSGPANFCGAPSLQGAIPLEGNSAMPNPPFVMPPQARPNHCVTHCFIARLIHYQQQLAKLNPFWYAASSAAVYGAKPCNPNILPQLDAMVFGSSGIRNSNILPNNGLGPASVLALNGHNSKEKASNSFADAQRKQPTLPQSAQQGAPFGFPVNQTRTGGTKSSSLAEDAGVQSASGGGAAAAAINMNFRNMGATPNPQNLAMLHNNYPFPIPPAYRAHTSQQQPPLAPFFNVPFYPSQLLQLQSPSPFHQTQNPATSTGSSSSQKRLQAQHCFPATKPPESLCSEPESTKNGEDDGAYTQASLAQKNPNNQNFSGNPIYNPNFLQNLAIMTGGMRGKQHPSADPCFQMNLKSMELTQTVPPAHPPVFQTLPDTGYHPYQIGDHQQVQAANQSKVPPKAQSKVQRTPSAGSPAGKVSKLPSSPLNSSRRGIPAGQSILAQSPPQVQSPAKTQKLLSKSEPMHQNSSSSGTVSSQKRSVDPNSAVQTMFPGSLNMRRSTNQQTQAGSPGQAVAGPGAFLVSGGKSPSVYSPLGGSSVAVMAAASYAQSASNIPVKSAEQKPAKA